MITTQQLFCEKYKIGNTPLTTQYIIHVRMVEESLISGTSRSVGYCTEGSIDGPKVGSCAVNDTGILHFSVTLFDFTVL